MTSQSAEELKKAGNVHFAAGRYEEAVKLFSEAIEADPQNHVLHSNRSACFAQLRKYQEALSDAESAIKLQTSWGKAYGRKGAALMGLGRFEDSLDAYRQGLQLEPDNAALKKGVADVEASLLKSKPSSPFDNMFGDDMFEKIAANPELVKYLAQPDFMRIMNEIKSNPSSLGQHLGDRRVMAVLGALMGVKVQSGDDFKAENFGDEQAEHEKQSEVKQQEAAHVPEVNMDEGSSEQTGNVETEVDSEQMNREQAAALKEEGNSLYKQKKFAHAIAKYDEATALNPSDITIMNNKAAVLLEMGQYDDCIKFGEEIVEKGREVRADFKNIARAFGRIGTAYQKKQDYVNAIKYFNKSLSEHRTAEVLGKLKECQKLKIEQEIAAYQDPAKSEEARNAGNDLFKAGQFADSVKQYTEAIKRNVSDPKSYSNRAASYIKLMALSEADKDIEQALNLDPHFVKAYVRKIQLLLLKKEFSKALQVCDDAIVIDSEHNDGRSRSELDQQREKIIMALYGQQQGPSSNDAEAQAQAMRDPKVQEILADPVMQQILQQMSSDPSAAQMHMQNPQIREKIQTLVAAGVVKTR